MAAVTQAGRCPGGQTGMAQTIERMNSPETKEQEAPTGPAAATVDERVPARRAREAKQAKATAVHEADRVSTDIGSPLVAPDGTPRTVPNLGRTVTVVGMGTYVDVNAGPHPTNIRGGPGKAMHHWSSQTVGQDPPRPAAATSHAA